MMILGSFLSAFLACGQAATEPPPHEAEALIRHLYDPYLTGGKGPGLCSLGIWSRTLQIRMEADCAKTRSGTVGALDFDPLIDAADVDGIGGLDIQSKPVSAGREVTAHFRNRGADTTVHYTLIAEGPAWKVDDIRTDRWKLRELLGDVRREGQPVQLNRP